MSDHGFTMAILRKKRKSIGENVNLGSHEGKQNRGPSKTIKIGAGKMGFLAHGQCRFDPGNIDSPPSTSQKPGVSPEYGPQTNK